MGFFNGICVSLAGIDGVGVADGGCGVFFFGTAQKWPTLWPILAALLLCTLAIAATVFAGYLFFKNIHPQWLFPYTFSWTLLFVAGSWILIRWGRRIYRRNSSERPPGNVSDCQGPC